MSGRRKWRDLLAETRAKRGNGDLAWGEIYGYSDEEGRPVTTKADALIKAALRYAECDDLECDYEPLFTCDEEPFPGDPPVVEVCHFCELRNAALAYVRETQSADGTASPRKGAVQTSGVPNSGTEGTDEQHD